MFSLTLLPMPAGHNVNGQSAKLHGKINPLVSTLTESKTIASNKCSFTGSFVPAVLELALSVKSSQGTIFRSGNIKSSFDDDNVFIIQKVDDMVITQADLAAMLPALPMVSGSTSVNTMSLSLRSGFVRAAGSGTIKVLGVKVPFTYTYDFDIKPVTDVFNPNRIVDIDTVDLEVKGNVGGVLGLLTNALISLIANFFEDKAAKSIETSIQDQVDDAIADQFADENPPPGTTVTVETVSISASGVVISPYGAVSLDNACSSGITFGSIKLRPREQMLQLKQIRRQLLESTPDGKVYMNIFYKHNAELLRLLVKNPKLLKLADKAVAGALKDFPGDGIAKGKLSRETAAHIKSALGMVRESGSKELRTAAVSLNRIVDHFTDKPALDLLKGKLIKVDIVPVSEKIKPVKISKITKGKKPKQ